MIQDVIYVGRCTEYVCTSGVLVLGISALYMSLGVDPQFVV